jgi:4-amino-4-deoxy-L-arabinose transferase-like glycosyltransferase
MIRSRPMARPMGLWVVVLVAAALAARWAFFLADPHPAEQSNLSAVSGEMARNIADHGRWFVLDQRAIAHVKSLQNRQGRLIDPEDINYERFDRRPRTEPEVLQPPGEAVLLAGLWKVTGDERYVYLQVLQVLLDAAMVPLVFWIALRLYDRPRAALGAAGAYAVFLPLAALPRVPHLDTWAVTLTIAVTALFLRGLEGRRSTAWLTATGLLAGLGAFFRPSIALIPVALAVAAAASTGWRPALRLAAIPLAVVVLVLVPWTIRNYDEFNRFIPVRTGLGQNLWEGLGEGANSIGAVEDDIGAQRFVQSRHPGLRYGSPEWDDELRRAALDGIRDHPQEYLKTAGRRVVRATIALHNPTWIEGTDPRLTDAPRDSVSHAVRRPWDGVRLGLYALLEPIVFLLAAATLVATWRSLWRRHVFLIAVVVVSLVTYVALHFEPRYVLPATFAYLILCGLGADLAWQRVAGAGGTRPAARD